MIARHHEDLTVDGEAVRYHALCEDRRLGRLCVRHGRCWATVLDGDHAGESFGALPQWYVTPRSAQLGYLGIELRRRAITLHWHATGHVIGVAWLKKKQR